MSGFPPTIFASPVTYACCRLQRSRSKLLFSSTVATIATVADKTEGEGAGSDQNASLGAVVVDDNRLRTSGGAARKGVHHGVLRERGAVVVWKLVPVVVVLWKLVPSGGDARAP